LIFLVDPLKAPLHEALYVVGLEDKPQVEALGV
jgi:hypothetical protein